MIRAGTRRLLILFAALAAGATVVPALIGLIVGASLARSASLGFYGVGAMCTAVGFALASRASFRMPQRHNAGETLAGPRHEAVRESRSTAAIMIAMGITLLVIGVAVDPRATLI